ncbi:P1 family peptidase [bacterium]|nr:P1 family peptidase [bacterium]
MKPVLPSGLIGHATHVSGSTGVTVMIFPEGASAGHHIHGHATGSRELDTLSPLHSTRQIHGICFAGGSVFGLAAVDGVVRELADRGIGLKTPHATVPIVPAAILYDLDGGEDRPDAELGRQATQNAFDRTATPLAGRVGAGAGARVARITGKDQPGGIGIHTRTHDGYTVTAIVAVNALGAIRDPETGTWVAGEPAPDQASFDHFPFGNTTLAAVITDVPLNRDQCILVARMASAGIARTHYPASTPLDGDVVFAVSLAKDAETNPTGVKRLTETGHLAAACVERAVIEAVSVQVER